MSSLIGGGDIIIDHQRSRTDSKSSKEKCSQVNWNLWLKTNCWPMLLCLSVSSYSGEPRAFFPLSQFSLCIHTSRVHSLLIRMLLCMGTHMRTSMRAYCHLTPCGATHPLGPFWLLFVCKVTRTFLKLLLSSVQPVATLTLDTTLISDRWSLIVVRIHCLSPNQLQK